jgi:DNA-binding CsgD family transcriptional regulator
MSVDFDSGAIAPNEDGAATAHILEPHVGKPGRGLPHQRYTRATRFAGGATILERSGLSPRECAILKLIGQGYSNKRVARSLGITAETVKWYVKRVFVKLDVNTRAHAVARAQSLGLFVAVSASESEDSAAAEERDPISEH